jgi:hypothetical protein
MITYRSDETEFEYDVRADFGFFPETSRSLIGWPGYRTLPGKSGLAYLETVAEEAHVEGLILRWLLIGKVITRNPVYLFVFFIYGMLTGGLPILFIAYGLFLGANPYGIAVLILGSPIIALGLGLLRNVWYSLTQPEQVSVLDD